MNELAIVFVVAFSFVCSALWKALLAERQRNIEEPTTVTEEVEGRGYGEVGVEVSFEAPDDGTAAAVLLAVAAQEELPSLYYRYPIHWHGTRTRTIKE